MICPNCRVNNDEGVQTCISCGTVLPSMEVRPTEAAELPKAEPVPAPAQTPPQGYYPPVPPCATARPPYGQPMPGYPVPMYGAPLEDTPAVGIVKKTAASTLFLVATIAMTVALLFSFLTGLVSLSQSSPFGMFGEFYDGLPYDTTFVAAPLAEEEPQTEISLSFSVPVTGILVVIALWMLYVGGKNHGRIGMSTAPFTLMKTATVIGIVGVSIVIFLVLLLAVLIPVILSTMSQEELFGEGLSPEELEMFSVIFTVVMILLIVLMLALLVFCIVYQAKVLRTIREIKTTVLTGQPSDKLSGLVGGMCYVIGVGNGLAAITPLFAFDLLSFSAGAAQAVAYLCFGVLFFRYRAEMRQLLHTQPAAIPSMD